MTAWSTPALLLLGIALGRHGLNLLSPSVLVVLDPAIAMALALLGVFVGLSFDPHQPRMRRLIAASSLSTVTTIALVGGAALVASSYWLSPDSPIWLLALMVGVCAAASAAVGGVNIDDVLMIIIGSLIVGAIRAPTGLFFLFALALSGISVIVAVAGWLLVGQTDSEGEQHVFVVGSLLLLGGAATYLSLSAVFAGLMAGVAWNLAGNVAKTRVIRDLHYFQHPLVVLALVVAGSGATLSVDAMALAAIFLALRTASRPIAAWMVRQATDRPSTAEGGFSLVSAGRVGIALALDAFRADERIEWTATLLGAIVIGTIVSEAISLFIPVSGASR